MTHHTLNPQAGYAILMIVLVVSIVFMVLLIPLITLNVYNTQTIQQNRQTNKIYYDTESSIHDSIAKMVATNFSWPAIGSQSITTTINNTQINKTITKDGSTDDISMTIQGSHRGINRTFQIDVSEKTLSSGDQIDLTIVLDISASMDNESGTPCDNGGQPDCEPLNSAREAAKVLINDIFAAVPGAGDAQVSLIKFNNQAAVVTSLNDNPTALNAILSGGAVKINPSQPYTNIGDGIHKAKLELDAGRPSATKIMVVLSDGSANIKGENDPTSTTICDLQPLQHNDCTSSSTNYPGGPWDPESVLGRADEAKSAGYTIYTIGLNLIELDPNAHAMVARQTLIDAASNPNYYYDSPTSSDLNTIFSNISTSILTVPEFKIQEIF